MANLFGTLKPGNNRLMAMGTKRFYEIDLFRFTAAALVVAFHYGFTNSVKGDISIGYPELVFSRYGFYGVNIFFVISGFVILTSAHGKSAIDFAASRIGRLYPAFWVACSLTALALVLFHVRHVGITQYLANMTMLGKFLGAHDIDGVYWTLYVEIRFYVMVFLLLCIGIKDFFWFIAVWLALSAINFFQTIPIVQNILILMWAPFFCAGCLFYEIASGRRTFRIVILLIVAMLLCHGYAMHDFQNMAQIYGYPFENSTLIIIESILFLLFTLSAMGVFQSISAAWMSWIGALTYPVYLTHAELGTMVFNYFGMINRWFLLVLIIVLELVLSYMIVLLVERKFASTLRKLSREAMTRVWGLTLARRPVVKLGN